jgi:uncharacterized protein
VEHKFRRILLLDVIRGIALFGILLVNMRSFHSPDFIATYHGIPPNYQGIENSLSIFLTSVSPAIPSAFPPY